MRAEPPLDYDPPVGNGGFIPSSPQPLPMQTYRPFYKQVWFYGLVAAILLILVVSQTTG